MGSLSIGYSTRALFGIPKQQSKEGLSGDCWRKGRFKVHVLLRLFANEQVHILHIGVECEWVCPFWSQTSPAVTITTWQPGMYDAASLARKS